jgi:hypothetical protein
VSPLVAHYSKAKLLLAIAAALAFVAISVLILTRPHPSFVDIAGGAAGLIFFGFCAIIVAVRLFDRRAVLVIDQHGLLDRRAKDRQLPWTSIAHIVPTRVGWQRFYLVLSAVPLRQFTDSRHKRALQALNRPWARNGFFVGANGLNVSFGQIGEAIHRFRPKGTE